MRSDEYVPFTAIYLHFPLNTMRLNGGWNPGSAKRPSMALKSGLGCTHHPRGGSCPQERKEENAELLTWKP